MTKREAEKVINYKGKSVRIRKFSPMDGGYIAQQILTSFLPTALESKLGVQRPVAPTQKMSKTEFTELMTDCLKYATYEQKDPVAVSIPILNENGTLAVADFGFEDTFLLTAEVLLFNMMGFFTPENMECFTQMMGSFTAKLTQTTHPSTSTN